MGPLVELAARRLNEPAVRSLATGLDWCDHARARAAELAADPSPRRLIADADPLAFAAHVAAALAAGRDLFLGHPQWTPAEAEAARVLMDRAPSSAAGRVMIPTGGSSGTLRFAIHTPETLAAAAHALREHLDLPELNSLCVLPLSHISGLQQLVRALATGGQLLLGDWKALESGPLPELPAGPWLLSLVPTQLQRLLDRPDAADWLRRFAAVFIGGAPAPAGLLARARGLRLPLAPAYGSTETAAQFSLVPPEHFLRDSLALELLPHATVRILGDDGAELPVGETGRIEVSATSLFRGYWPQIRAAAAWLSDDLGRLNPAGRIELLGRADEAINTGGKKVQPAEVEAALRATGRFTEVVVVGTPDPDWGEVVTACHPAGDRPDLAAVERDLRAGLSAYKLPRRWVPLDPWPRTPQGKTDRAAVRTAVRGAGAARDSA